MASRYKLEEHIRDRFGKREIAPSDRAWDQLSSELEVQGKGKGGFFRLAAAAVLIGLLVGSLVYFNTMESPETQEIEVVERPRSGTGDGPDRTIVEIGTDKVVGDKGDVRILPKMERGVKEVDNGSVLKPFTAKTDSELVLIESETKIPEKERAIGAAQEIINSKIEEVIAQVTLLERTDAAITDAEVDSLLLQAQRELFADRIFRDDHSVDAMALLADVEGELDRPFREQLFDMLKEGYFKARNAVAARNK